MIYLEFFLSFLKIGAFTLGGGYAMIPLIRKEVVEKKKWIDDEEFLNMLALSQSVPGVMAVNAAFFVGYKLKGAKGAFCTILGSILPSFVIILLIAAVFTRYRHLPQIEAIFKGIRPAVVALIAAPLWNMARAAGMMKTDKHKYTNRQIIVSWLLLALPIASALLIWLCNISPIWIIIITIVSALAIVEFRKRRSKL
ncbi:MAG: chromate transporter [Paludibacteraceae bacterium]|nr:chromate transporter [Paludibacteraceae bacterium]